MGNCRVRDERLATCGSPGGRPIAALQLTALALAPALALASSLAAPACSDPRVATDQPPIAFAGYDEVRRLELGEDGLPRPIRYTLDGTRSLDPDGPGQRLAYRWHQAGGPKLPEPLAISEPKQVLLLTEPGLYTFVLVVSSAGLASIPDAANLLLLPPTSNNPPVPVLRYRPSYPVVGQEVWLDGSESTDPDPGDFVLGWLWQLTEPDGVQRLLPGVEQTSFIPQYAGPYLVTFSVLDSHRAQASIVQEIPVLPCAATGPELCNGKDDDCDGERDEDFDLDGDGHTTCNDDCDDGNPEIHGGAREVCDGVDNDCDEQTDEGFDADGEGHTFCGGDC
ncbi:MAG: hypothetical protein FJ125_08930, partial [Deltaproteobacteria bacterium]|nr:hypothetical protein [Deltaproteobacteria bacterium]